MAAAVVFETSTVLIRCLMFLSIRLMGTHRQQMNMYLAICRALSLIFNWLYYVRLKRVGFFDGVTLYFVLLIFQEGFFFLSKGYLPISYVFYFGLCHILSTSFIICAYLKYIRRVSHHPPSIHVKEKRSLRWCLRLEVDSC